MVSVETAPSGTGTAMPLPATAITAGFNSATVVLGRSGWGLRAGRTAVCPYAAPGAGTVQRCTGTSHQCPRPTSATPSLPIITASPHHPSTACPASSILADLAATGYSRNNRDEPRGTNPSVGSSALGRRRELVTRVTRPEAVRQSKDSRLFNRSEIGNVNRIPVGLGSLSAGVGVAVVLVGAVQDRRGCASIAKPQRRNAQHLSPLGLDWRASRY